MAELKKLYQYECQICGNGDDAHNIPKIKKGDGTNYVEVHHIIPLKEDKYNEELNLDKLENMIVLCPYHHMFLHHNLGGNYILKNEGGDIYLTNDKCSVMIVKNNHLMK